MSKQGDVYHIIGRSGVGHNQRLYGKFKQAYEVEPYCFQVLNRRHRGALAKFRTGTVSTKNQKVHKFTTRGKKIYVLF